MEDNLARVDHNDIPSSTQGSGEPNIGRTRDSDWRELKGTAPEAPIERDPRESVRETIEEAVEDARLDDETPGRT